MSDNKLNSLGFDEDELLSNLEALKAKYSAYDEKSDDEEAANPPEKEASFSKEESSDNFFSYDRDDNESSFIPDLNNSSSDNGDDIYSEASFVLDNEEDEDAPEE